MSADAAPGTDIFGAATIACSCRPRAVAGGFRIDERSGQRCGDSRSGCPWRPARRRGRPADKAEAITNSCKFQQADVMTQDMIRNRWFALRGKLKERWGKLTHEDIHRDGHREYLINKLQERYGIAKEKARIEVKEFERTLR
jgi:uncharacterized protein YjbJ (UPF0337 family)